MSRPSLTSKTDLLAKKFRGNAELERVQQPILGDQKHDWAKNSLTDIRFPGSYHCSLKSPRLTLTWPERPMPDEEPTFDQ